MLQLALLLTLSWSWTTIARRIKGQDFIREARKLDAKKEQGQTSFNIASETDALLETAAKTTDTSGWPGSSGPPLLEVEVSDKTGSLGKTAGSCKIDDAEATTNWYDCMEKTVKQKLTFDGLCKDCAIEKMTIKFTVDGTQILREFPAENFESFFVAAQKKAGEGNPVTVKAFVLFEEERDFDKDVIKYLREVRKHDPAKENSVKEELRKKGIFRGSQFGGFQLPEDGRALDKDQKLADLTRRSQNEIKKEEAVEGNTKKAADKDKDSLATEKKIKEERDLVKKMISDREDERKEVEKKLETMNTKSMLVAKAEAQNNLKDINANLDKLKLAEANLETAEVEGAVDKLIKEGQGSKKVGGKHLEVESLIRTLALDHGILIDNGLKSLDTPRKALFQLKKTFKDAYSSILDEMLLKSVSKPAKQCSFESRSAENIQRQKSTRRKVGESSANSWLTGNSAGGIGAAFGIAGSAKGSGTSANSSVSEEDKTKKVQEKVSEYYKVTEFLEPRGFISLELNNLEPTPEAAKELAVVFTALKKKWRGHSEGKPKAEGQVEGESEEHHKAKAKGESKKQSVGLLEDESQEPTESLPKIITRKSLQEFISDWGSHFCPHALLGGRWEIFAQAKSDGTTTEAQMASATSDATNKAIEASYAVGGYYGVVVAKNNGGMKNESEASEAEGTKMVAGDAFANKHTEVRQEWLGGISGVKADDWRDSLSFNSNWRIIDREVNSCYGVWHLLEYMVPVHVLEGVNNTNMKDLANDLCLVWVNDFFKPDNSTRSEGMDASKLLEWMHPDRIHETNRSHACLESPKFGMTTADWAESACENLDKCNGKGHCELKHGHGEAVCNCISGWGGDKCQYNREDEDLKESIARDEAKKQEDERKRKELENAQEMEEKRRKEEEERKREEEKAKKNGLIQILNVGHSPINLFCYNERDTWQIRSALSTKEVANAREDDVENKERSVYSKGYCGNTCWCHVHEFSSGTKLTKHEMGGNGVSMKIGRYVWDGDKMLKREEWDKERRAEKEKLRAAEATAREEEERRRIEAEEQRKVDEEALIAMNEAEKVAFKARQERDKKNAEDAAQRRREEAEEKRKREESEERVEKLRKDSWVEITNHDPDPAGINFYCYKEGSWQKVSDHAIKDIPPGDTRALKMTACEKRGCSCHVHRAATWWNSKITDHNVKMRPGAYVWGKNNKIYAVDIRYPGSKAIECGDNDACSKIGYKIGVKGTSWMPSMPWND